MNVPVVSPHDYCRVRALTEVLAGVMSAEDQTVQSMSDASPTKWHRAHVTDEAMLNVLADQPSDEVRTLAELGLHHELPHARPLVRGRPPPREVNQPVTGETIGDRPQAGVVQ
jgi:hypothetical protein